MYSTISFPINDIAHFFFFNLKKKQIKKYNEKQSKKDNKREIFQINTNLPRQPRIDSTTNVMIPYDYR